MKNPIIVALDLPDAASALRLAERLTSVAGAFKIGKELFTASGPDIVRQFRAAGASVFLDLKFYDIPHTVAKAVEAATRLDVQMMTIHTSGGLAMMQAAEKAAQETARQLDRPAPLVLGVTVLTSMDAHDLAQTGVNSTPAEQVMLLAQLAAQSGLRGLVCSPQEITALRKVLPSTMQLVTPGIRPAGSEMGDQKRTLTPKEAIAAGANALVIGRPITGATNPQAAAQSILDSLN